LFGFLGPPSYEEVVLALTNLSLTLVHYYRYAKFGTGGIYRTLGSL